MGQKVASLVKSIMKTPVGINNFSGDVFRCFTKGETLPFKFTFRNQDKSIMDTAGWEVIVTFTSVIECNSTMICGEEHNTDKITVEHSIPASMFEGGIFLGNFPGKKTERLPCGLVFASARYVVAPEEGQTHGNSYMIDMCQLEVYPNLTSVTD